VEHTGITLGSQKKTVNAADSYVGVNYQCKIKIKPPKREKRNEKPKANSTFLREI